MYLFIVISEHSIPGIDGQIFTLAGAQKQLSLIHLRTDPHMDEKLDSRFPETRVDTCLAFARFCSNHGSTSDTIVERNCWSSPPDLLLQRRSVFSAQKEKACR